MANAAKKEQPVKIGPVDLSKVDRKVLVKYATKLKVGTSKDTTEALVTALVALFAKLPAKRTADCTNCGGDSDIELDECPFCGDANEEEDEASGSASASDDDDASDDEDASSASTDASTASASRDDEPEDIERAKTLQEAPAANISGAGVRRMKKPGSTAMTATPAVVDMVIQYTEKDLDAAVERVNHLKGEPLVGFWRLGGALSEIYNKQLWRQRNKDDGSPAYKSFNQFAVKELGFTVQNAYWLIDIATNFSEEQAREFGQTKLNAILSAPKTAEPKLLEAARAGATVRQLKEMGAQAHVEAGTADVERDTGRRKPRKKGARVQGQKKPKKPTKALEPTIVVANLIGKQTVKLFKLGKPEDRAKKFADNAVGVLDLENSARMHFAVASDPSGNWVLRIDVKRIEVKKEE